MCFGVGLGEVVWGLVGCAVFCRELLGIVRDGEGVLLVCIKCKMFCDENYWLWVCLIYFRGILKFFVGV